MLEETGDFYLHNFASLALLVCLMLFVVSTTVGRQKILVLLGKRNKPF